ncbi:MAG TPA: PilZ domain-containing protein [Gemmataceae bacterium]|nr:PilZ domain-containing protein [Gemmataceae bacterium]
MQNRRQHYRHEFGPTRLFKVWLQAAQGATVVEAEVINLSTGGLCVFSPELRSANPSDWVATIALDTETQPLNVPVQRVYARHNEQACCGFQFQSMGAEADEERERAIWRFLLREQRRRWQMLRGA